jgi:hypothetical protein
LAFDRLAASGAQPRQSEIERGTQQRAYGTGAAFEPRRGSDTRQFPEHVSHDATLPLHHGLVMSFALRAFCCGT